MEAIIKNETADRRAKMLPSTKEKIAAGKRLTKLDMGYQIGRFQACHPAAIYWDQYSRDDMVGMFNQFFGTDIK